jgi:hypothetical protein
MSCRKVSLFPHSSVTVFILCGPVCYQSKDHVAFGVCVDIVDFTPILHVISRKDLHCTYLIHFLLCQDYVGIAYI